jgi:cytochrome c peroxidase
VFLLVAACRTPNDYRPSTPLGLDLFAPVPESNPLSRGRVALGRRLFTDPLLSVDRSVSCASCHRPSHAFSDTVARSSGSHGRAGPRNAPSLLNAAYRDAFFWDGRATSLEEQVLQPIQDSLEMDLPMDQLVARLRADGAYRATFRREFGEEPNPKGIALALASFVRTLRSGDAAIDRFRNGDSTALSPLARRGFQLFVGRAGCSACHLGPLLSDGDFHNTGVAWRDGSWRDLGRFVVTRDSADRGAFKTPSLRNVARTAPYMHDGSIATLDAVIDFYDRGAGRNPNLDPVVRPLRLTPEERRSLLAFLESLSGR